MQSFTIKKIGSTKFCFKDFRGLRLVEILLNKIYKEILWEGLSELREAIKKNSLGKFQEDESK